eukprot:TRINITY_DN13690_c0_g1_i1.p1 TRINITY_DN13690_c0_g1~~TRINITY_DN13690_c0_g1_i1.p1  ORF type:complete len:287 (+),score=105.62 TRINITY_DN13690_c0_g1_i1:84-944(+)
MSLLPKTHGRDVTSIAADVRQVLGGIHRETQAQGAADAGRCQLLRATLLDIKQTVVGLKAREDMRDDEVRVVKALGREMLSLDPLFQRLAVMEREARSAPPSRQGSLMEPTPGDEVPLTAREQSFVDSLERKQVLLDEEEQARAAEQALEKIQQDMEVIHAMKQALGQSIAEDGEDLDAVEDGTLQAVEKTDGALTELKGGAKRAYSGMGTTFGVVAGVVTAGVGIGVGLAAAPIAAVGVGGALVGRFVGKKVAKSAVQNATAGIDAHLEASPAVQRPAPSPTDDE